MIAQALTESDEIVREVAEGGGAREQCHAAVFRQRRDGLLHPRDRGLPVNQRARIREQAAAELGRFIA